MKNFGPVVLVLIGLSVFMIKATTPAKINILEHCLGRAPISYHAHPKLSIIVNGENQEIPANIGMASTCTRLIHTHTNDGVLHLEFTEQYDFRLEDFFQVWGKTFNSRQVGDWVKDQNDELMMTVDGQVNNDWENLILADKQQIVIRFNNR